MPRPDPHHRPVDRHSLPVRDESTRMAAKQASERLLLALLRYGARHGLPNIDADQCRARLEAL